MHWAVQVVFCLFVFFIPLVSLCSVKPSWTLKESQRNPDVSSLSSYWLRLSRFFSGCTTLQLSCWFIINNSQLLFFLCITVFKVPSCLLIWQWKANTFAIAEQHCNSVNFGSSVECLIVTGHFIRYSMIAEGWKSYSLTASTLHDMDSARSQKHSSEILVHSDMIASQYFSYTSIM